MAGWLLAQYRRWKEVCNKAMGNGNFVELARPVVQRPWSWVVLLGGPE